MVPQRIFLAGATGAVGRRLLPLLISAGHHVVGSTRSNDKAKDIEALGAEASIVDAFDADALAHAVARARPGVVIHQLTDLSGGFAADQIATTLEHNAQMRRQGTVNLVKAAIAAGAIRVIAQSIAWAYATGKPPFDEDAPLDMAATGARRVTVTAVSELESVILGSPATFEGIVLRYGQLYGPGTGNIVGGGTSPVHVDAAAYAAVLAINRGAAGVYNIADGDSEVSNRKAVRELGWRPSFRLSPMVDGLGEAS